MTDIDFEELAADLIAADVMAPVERFGRGADGGVDLRWQERSGGVAIAQCKHYLDSTFAQLKSSAAKEVPKLEKLQPSRYLFITSQVLTRNQKQELMTSLAGWIKSEKDVLSGTDVDQMLDRHRVVERKHVKLWLSTGTELFWATHADLLNRSEALRKRIDRTIAQYVGSKAFEEASQILEQEKVCLVAGQPGIGKTVLAHMLLADHMTRDFEIVEVSGDINEAWAALDADRPQVFFYDDFLGQLSFSERMNKNEDARLADFVDRVRELKSKRLILTTREYILQDAKRYYARLSDVNKRGKYILELKDYGRDDKARILYNHLWRSSLDRADLLPLADGGWRRVVDHPNYSPRLVEYGVRLPSQGGAPWLDHFVGALNNPASLWKQSFEVHLTETERAVLYVLASFGRTVEVSAAEKAHRQLCNLLNVPCLSGDFRRALEIMEGTFLEFEKDHRGAIVSFNNPSIVDFVLNELRHDAELQSKILRSATHFEQVENLWSRSAASITVRDRESSSRTRVKVLDETAQRSYSRAVARTFSAKPLQRSTSYYGATAQSREERLSFISKLPPGWKPKSKWVRATAKNLMKRWERHKGDKSKAFELIFGRESISESFPAQARAVLEVWIKNAPAETSDWILIGQLLELEGESSYDEEFAEDFRSHVNSELERWDPTPPELDELLSLSKKFGTDDLDEYLLEAMALDSELDEEAAESSGERQRIEPIEQDQKDEYIERYFDHF